MKKPDAATAKPRCGAKKKTGGLCARFPGPNGRCKMHGGASTGPPIKHGRRSKYVRYLGTRFAELVADAQILESLDELALYDTFLVEQVEELQKATTDVQKHELWKVILGVAGARAGLAARAATVAARQEEVVTERDMLAFFARLMDMVQREIGPDAARRIGARFEIEVLGERCKRLQASSRSDVPDAAE